MTTTLFLIYLMDVSVKLSITLWVTAITALVVASIFFIISVDSYNDENIKISKFLFKLTAFILFVAIIIPNDNTLKAVLAFKAGQEAYQYLSDNELAKNSYDLLNKTIEDLIKDLDKEASNVK